MVAKVPVGVSRVNDAPYVRCRAPYGAEFHRNPPEAG